MELIDEEELLVGVGEDVNVGDPDNDMPFDCVSDTVGVMDDVIDAVGETVGVIEGVIHV